MLLKNFSLFSADLYERIYRARPVRKPDGSRTKMAETLVFLREFRSLTAGPAGHTGQQDARPVEAGNFFGSFREFLRSFGEL